MNVLLRFSPALNAVARVMGFVILRRSSLAVALLDFILQLTLIQLTLTYGDRLCSSSSFPLAAWKAALSARSPWRMLTLR